MNKQIISFLLVLLSFQLQAQKERPKIGLALSGGGAKGISHIGVLKVLEEAGIRPDYITGASIGSIMGGLYAIGYSVEDMERIAIELDWAYYFNDELKRTDLPIEERQYADRYQLKVGIEDGKVQLPKGFIQGQKIGLLLSQLTFPAHGVHDFDQFKIPFRCVATDAETGDVVVLKSGSLAKAMRASMSLPSIFEPMELDGKLLIDGGVVRNLPVIEAIDMGADIVIAVDITSPLYKKEGLVSLVQVLEQTSSYKLAESVELQKQLADIVISPDITGIGTLDFDRGADLLKLGEAAARAALPEIVALISHSDSLDSENVNIPTVCKICNVQLKGIEGKRKNAVANVMQMRATKEYSMDVIEKRIKQLFGSQFFKDAYYELTPSEEGFELSIDAALKSGEYLQVSANYDSDLKAALLLNATFRNRGLSGSKLSIDLKLSEFPLLLANYQVYTTSQPNFGIHLGGKLNHFPLDLYNEEGSVRERTGMTHYELRLDLFTSFNNSSLLSGGIGLERYSQRDKFFEGGTESLAITQQTIYARYLRDTYDREHYPREGSFLAIDGKLALSSSLKFPFDVQEIGINSFNKLARIQFSKIFPVDKSMAIEWYVDAGAVAFQKTETSNSFLNLFFLGRSIPEELSHVEFVGLDYMELPVSSYWLSGVRWRTELKEDAFASLLLNYGQYRAKEYDRIFDNTFDAVPDIEGDILGVGLEIGVISPLGPGRFATEYNLLEKRFNFAFHLGYVF